MKPGKANGRKFPLGHPNALLVFGKGYVDNELDHFFTRCHLCVIVPLELTRFSGQWEACEKVKERSKKKRLRFSIETLTKPGKQGYLGKVGAEKLSLNCHKNITDLVTPFGYPFRGDS